jgi:uncharacterized protein YceK
MRSYAALIAGVLMPLLAGCGSFSTLSKDDDEIKHGLSQYRTNCASLPRVYSGVSYDICKVNSSTTEFPKQLKEMLYFLDIIPSAILDTAALPYSIHKQNKDGSLALE